ncbi:MAG: hypothetical protein D4R68_05770 [Ignavibacteriales bacterium]|nr:MAG: hypothetical protein D4R68_05770 [Ignavibacteriales bacterium]
MEGQAKKKITNIDKFKKVVPYIILFLLTIALMFFFKYNRRDISRIIETGKNNLLALAKNLKPLLFETEINNEDVFNFALYQSIPLDKGKNKVLLISKDEPGNNIYEIKPASYNQQTKNYDTFVKLLGLNKKQKAEADSILNSYKKEIYSSVLVNDKSTIAVNPRLPVLQQAVLADIISFAQKVDETKSKELFPNAYKFYNNEKISNMIVSAKEIPQNEYILISPDTVARTYFKWDQEKFNKHLADFEKSKSVGHPPMPKYDFNFDVMPEKVKNKHSIAVESDYSFKLDSNLFKVVIPAETINGLSDMISDSIRVKLNEAAKQLKNISIPVFVSQTKSHKPPKIYAPPNAGNDKQTKLIDPYEIVNKTMELLSKQDFSELEKFGAKMDSIASHKYTAKDSSAKRKIREAMMKLKKDLKKYKHRKTDSTSVN